jgi:hypothetical protein
MHRSQHAVSHPFRWISPATTKAAADITSSGKSFFIFTHGRVQNEQHAGENQQWQREDDGFGVKWHTVKS